jgi:histidinol-phosphate aminotransferase
MVDSLVPENIRSLTPYPPGKPLSELERELGISRAIKLASNENALGPSPRALEAIQNALTELHRYPDGGAFYLRRRLSKHLNVDPEQLLLGNGSNEIIELLIRTFGSKDAGVLTSETTFVVYRLTCQAAGVPFVAVPMNDLHFDLEAIAERVTADTRLIFLCNPNNPTGTMFNQDAFDRFLDRIGDEAIVVLDEAYIEYVPLADRIRALELVAKRPRTVVLRTFSKAYGLAGLRIGYGITSPAIADYVNRVRQPFNVNNLAQVGATAALDDTEHLARVIALTMSGKQVIYDGITSLGLSYTPSWTNFVLFDTFRDANPLYQSMLKQGVIVRPMSAYGLPAHLRVNMGLEEENARFLVALKSALNVG